jgi:two-component system sensor histidine kinase KdpD
LGENELAVAEWSYKNGRPAGRGTDTLPAAQIRFSPLKTARGIVGILGVKPLEPQNILSSDQRILLEGFANLSALAIERASFAEEAAQTDMLQKTEKLQTALLNSISHEFRTPLSSILGVLTSLSESERDEQTSTKLDRDTRLELIDSATKQARRLNRLVENLLDMTRLEAGAIHLNREPLDIQDLIGTVLYRMVGPLGNRPVLVDIPSEIPLITADAVLIGEVFSNVLGNACKYSPSDSPIDISIRKEDQDKIIISIKDYGLGIPPEDLERIFDKFYRVQRQNQVSGTGLGLTICKGIVEAHGGRIWAENNPDRGITITFSLPIQP